MATKIYVYTNINADQNFSDTCSRFCVYIFAMTYRLSFGWSATIVKFTADSVSRCLSFSSFRYYYFTSTLHCSIRSLLLCQDSMRSDELCLEGLQTQGASVHAGTMHIAHAHKVQQVQRSVVLWFCSRSKLSLVGFVRVWSPHFTLFLPSKYPFNYRSHGAVIAHNVAKKSQKYCWRKITIYNNCLQSYIRSLQ